MRFFVGIDYSMSCPAVSVMPESGLFKETQIGYMNSKKPKKVLPNVLSSTALPTETQQARFNQLGSWALDFISSHCTPETAEIFLEDYAFGAGAKGKVFEIGENGGILKHKLWQAGFKINYVPPTVLKKYATGKGTAKKEQMHEAFLKKAKVDLIALYQPISEKVSSPVSDIVDSFFLADYGRMLP